MNEPNSDGTLPFQKPRHFRAARLKLIDKSQIEQVLVLLRIIEKIHDGETEIILIGATNALDIEYDADNKNSAEIASRNRAAQLIKDESTVSRGVRRKGVGFRENCFEEKILHRKRNRPRGIRDRLNHQIEIGCLSETGENFPGRH